MGESNKMSHIKRADNEVLHLGTKLQPLSFSRGTWKRQGFGWPLLPGAGVRMLPRSCCVSLPQ